MSSGAHTGDDRAARGRAYDDGEGYDDGKVDFLDGFHVVDGRDRSFSDSFDEEEGDDYEGNDLWQCMRCRSYSPGKLNLCVQCYEPRPRSRTQSGVDAVELDDKDPITSHGDYIYDDYHDGYEDTGQLLTPEAPRYGYDDDEDLDDEEFETFPQERENSGTGSFHEKFDMFVVMDDIPFSGLPGEGVETPNRDVEEEYRQHVAQLEFRVGDEVEVHYDKEGMYYAATIVKIGHKGFDYGVTYHDIQGVVLGTNAPTIRRPTATEPEQSHDEEPKSCGCWCFGSAQVEDDARVLPPRRVKKPRVDVEGKGTFT